MARKNRLKTLIQQGTPALGAWVHSGNAMAAEVMAIAGFDALILDHEHGPGDFLSAVSVLQAVKGHDISMIMRVPDHDAINIRRALDIGCDGVLVPLIETAAQARAAAAACRYPPVGTRGAALGAIRASGYGTGIADYLRFAAEEILCICQIETVAAVDAIADIAAVEGVDMLFVGPSDMTASAGKLGQPMDDEMRALLTRTEKAILATGTPMASVFWDEDLFARGYCFIAGGHDLNLLYEGSRAKIAAMRPKDGA